MTKIVSDNHIPHHDDPVEEALSFWDISSTWGCMWWSM